MAYFEINDLVVKHKSFDGIKTVLDIDHIEINKGETFGIVPVSPARERRSWPYPSCSFCRHRPASLKRVKFFWMGKIF